ncbi:MAG: TetR family transcriptional regulator C-terminal domain-containing protein [Polyangiaceae bacterium]|nr:TetR family transcriptional regulator C-terminal domain-containing protein [Polyangiaceae bacterium]
MGRPSNTEARRAQIADAMIAVVAGVGLDAATVPAVAAAAGLSPGLVHYHFASKDEILPLAVERLGLRLEVRAEARLRAAGDDPRARLHALCDAWLARGEGEDPGAVRAWAAIGAAAARREDVRALTAAFTDRAVERVRREVARALPPGRRRRARDVATSVVLFMEGALRVGTMSDALAPGDGARLSHGLIEALLDG